jgi:nicotinate-nucleotide adenylyltransferase
MKIGLFFGSFNPIHVGHMVLANYMLSFTDLDQIWFIVSPHNPLKQKSTLLDANQRLHMVNLAIGDKTNLKASNIEFKLPQPSYTINTLVHLKEKYPKNEFVLLMGADNLQNFHKWKNYEEILKYHELYVYPRVQGPDTSPAPLERGEVRLTNIKLVNAPIIEISSTFIREAIKEKKDISYFIPPEVLNYIEEMHFYKK